jgi:hypothetical protein
MSESNWQESFSDKKEGKETKITVERGLVSARKIDSGQEFAVRNMTLGRREISGEFSYYQLKDLSNTKKVELLIRDAEGAKRVGLPIAMLDRLGEYLRTERDLTDYNMDCSAFAHLLNDIPHQFAKFDPNRWDLLLLSNEDDLKIGDTVLLSTGESALGSEIVHFAIYIGDGLYISKFGTSGSLITTTLEEMRKGFGGEFLFKGTPKQEHQNPGIVGMGNYRSE